MTAKVITLPSTDHRELQRAKRYFRGRQSSAETARLRDMWLKLANHVEACEQEVARSVDDAFTALAGRGM